ncbi:unnamed protein product [Closterium sp. Naga37s-1]|nr:unnamed protein product [Closterium sp. Naga37s-1]
MTTQEGQTIPPLEQQEKTAGTGMDAGTSATLPADGQVAPAVTTAPVPPPASPVPDPVAPAPATPAAFTSAGGEEEDEVDDDGYLSDDPEEGIEVHVKGALAAKARVTLMLLIPFEMAKEMPAVKPSVKALLVFLRKKLSDKALDEIAFQELLPTYLSKIHFSRLQVTLATAEDAEVSAGVVRKILRDPALVLISTGANVEEWLCVQECCERAYGDSFAQAVAHIGSFSHGAALGSAGVATRMTKAKQSLHAAKKLYGIRAEKAKGK